MDLRCVYTIRPANPGHDIIICQATANYLVNGNSLCKRHLIEYRNNQGRTEEQMGGH